MTSRRILTAFAVAPAPLPLFVFARTLNGPWSLSDAVTFAGIYAVVTYGSAVLGGVPVYLTFERKGWNAWWQYALAGSAIGLAVLVATRGRGAKVHGDGTMSASSCDDIGWIELRFVEPPRDDRSPLTQLGFIVEIVEGSPALVTDGGWGGTRLPRRWGDRRSSDPPLDRRRHRRAGADRSHRYNHDS
jgi:hypothetical protein